MNLIWSNKHKNNYKIRRAKDWTESKNEEIQMINARLHSRYYIFKRFPCSYTEATCVIYQWSELIKWFVPCWESASPIENRTGALEANGCPKYYQCRVIRKVLIVDTIPFRCSFLSQIVQINYDGVDFRQLWGNVGTERNSNVLCNSYFRTRLIGRSVQNRG